MTGLLAGKVVACIGAGSGIGLAAARAFVEHGATLAAFDLNAQKVDALAAQFPDALTVTGDATSVADVGAFIESVGQRFGRLDVLATFVGVFDHYRALADIDPQVLDAAFTEMFEVNVKSVLIAAGAALPALRASRGSIVVTLSSSSFYPGRGGILYIASKFALRGVVVQLAHEVAPEVRVNGVAPGGTLDTDLRGLTSLGLADARLNNAADREGRAAAMVARTPLQVALDPGDHAGAYVFLATDQARGITGEIIRSDGGLGVR